MSNKKWIIIVSIILTIGLISGGICYFVFQGTDDISSPSTEPEIQKKPELEEKEQEIKPEEIFIEKTENGIIIDKKTNQEIYNPNVEYPEKEEEQIRVPEEMDDGYISEYLKWILIFYPERSFITFTEEEIASIVSMSANLYEPRTEKEVQKVAKRYFNIDNYELPTGTYEIENFGKYTISKSNGYYARSSIVNKVESINSWFYTDLKIDGNKIVISYDYASDGLISGGCYSPLKSKEENEKCILGYYKIYMTYTPNRLNIDEIKYVKK